MKKYFDQYKVGAELIIAGSWVFYSIVWLVLFLLMFRYSSKISVISELLGDKQGISFFIVLGGIPAFLFVKSIYIQRRLRYLQDYNRIMGEYPEAELPLEILAVMADVSFRRAVKDLRWLFKNNVMWRCFLILDEKPKIVLTDILLDQFYLKDRYCPDCFSPLELGPVSSVRCPQCGRAFPSIWTEKNENFTVVDWSCLYSRKYQDPFRIEKIQNISSVMRTVGISFVLMAAGFVCDMLSDQNKAVAVTSKGLYCFGIAAVIGIDLLLLYRFISQSIELAVRSDAFFARPDDDRIPIAEIASMMRWSAAKTVTALGLCFFLKILTNCSYRNGIIKIERYTD